ncbi:hypothetical protein K7472_20940 [Streptomyces sp. PTM05]|uniref:UmuC domain-containing protein n=2 Tax=Streptantibioticus parmotrematis TaxID=2873249 RepID=A0ABS7QVQ3_9ACTN|nr:hypothetical protein [Streptantibioticus parmotrematis]
MMVERERVIMHVRCPREVTEDAYHEVVEFLGSLTPVVQALPPAAVLADLTGALRYWRATPLQLARRVRLTTLARYAVDTRVGIGPSPAVAAMASGSPDRDGIRIVTGADAAQAIAPLPVSELYGVGPAQAKTLTAYGLHTVGALAQVPTGTVQRLLGGRLGRQAADRARGIDPRHELDRNGRARTALLDTVVTVASRLRQRRQVAGALSVHVEWVGNAAAITRTRTLAEPTAHTEELRVAAYQLWDGLGLQRARIAALSVRAERLTDGAAAAHQMTLDGARERLWRAEAAIDRANRRFGANTVRPARLAHRPMQEAADPGQDGGRLGATEDATAQRHEEP